MVSEIKTSIECRTVCRPEPAAARWTDANVSGEAIRARISAIR